MHLLLSHDVYFGFTHLEGYMEDRFIAHFDELPRMAHLIWMIARVRGSFIGNEISHVYHHSYLKEAMGQ